MSTLGALFPRVRLGVALAPDRLLAISSTGGRQELASDGDVLAAFASLRDALGLPRAFVTVALLPPLVDVRRLTLPPLRDQERRRVLARDAARYFVDVREPQVVGTVVLATKATPVPVLAAAASARLVEEIEAAVEATGWTLAGIVPAHAAWAAGAARTDGHVAARLSQATEVLRVEGRRVVERRRLPPASELPTGTAVLDDPLASAAISAPGTADLELCSDPRHAARTRVARRVALGLAMSAAACLLLAGGLDYWGLARELDAVHARRRAIREDVAAAMQARDSLGTVAGSLASLRRLEATSPRWSALLADLADYLPRDAHVVALRGAGDSVVFEGVARQAAGVFQAVQQMPRVSGVRAEAPIRQSVASDGSVREQFALGTRLRTAGSEP